MSDCFCGSCGEQCEPIEHHYRYIDHGYGATRTFQAVEIVSDCCGSDDLYRDEELTEEYDPELAPV